MKNKMSAAKSIPYNTVSLKRDGERPHANRVQSAHQPLKLVPPLKDAPHSRVPTGQRKAVALTRDRVPLPSPPSLASYAYHGPLGKIVRAIDPHSEAEPMAVLLQSLVSFGNIVGRGPSLQVQADYLHTNLNGVLVGPTAAGRKGTSWGWVKRIFSEIDPPWVANNIQKDLYTAEGLINAVRDPAAPTTKEDSRHHDPGIQDKRLQAVLGEFVAALKRANLPGNTLSATIRSAADGDVLQILTKNTPLKATDAHISVIGHITMYDLPNSLHTELYNGFANRFLWVWATRSKSLPNDPGPDIGQLGQLIQMVTEAVVFSKSVGEMKKSDKAARLWARIYHGFYDDRDELPPKIEALTARGLPHMLRMAMIYALLDKSEVIKVVHVKAARAVWRYVEDSIKYIFGSSDR